MDNLQTGQTLGPYRILNQVGKGGMATVYRAYHAATDRYVAIKLLPRELAESPEFVGRFQQEARTIARLEHAHILPVYDFGQDGPHTYLVMRYLEAGTLADRLPQGGLPLAEADRILAQLATALQYAHARGIIHRDLKPANVLVDASGNVYLTDFGIAKLLQADARFTGTGAMIGTPAYMSPEQGQGLPVDQRSDIYSLGIILYEMVTGHPPFQADTPVALVYQHVNAPLPLPSAVKPGLPAEVERVVLKALAKNPADRYGSAGDLLDAWRIALRAVPGLNLAERPSGAAPTVASPPTQASPARRRTGWLALFGGMGALGALGVLGCGVLACLAFLAWQFLAAMSRGAAGDPTRLAATAVFTPVVAASTPTGGSPIALETGLPRAVTYSGLVHTVTGAVLESEPASEYAGFVPPGSWVARLAVRVENTTRQYTYLAPGAYRLRLADGEAYPALHGEITDPEAGASQTLDLLFAVPAGTAWEGAMLEIGDAGYVPAMLPLTGAAPVSAYPRSLALPVPAEFMSDQERVQGEVLSVALDVDWQIERAETGGQYLVLVIRLTNLGHPSGLLVSSDWFRLLVDQVPLAPHAGLSEVLAYQAASDLQVVFAVPAGAHSAELQVGSVTAADTVPVRLTLDLSGD